MQPEKRQTDLSLARSGARGLIVSAIVFSIFTNLLMLTGPLFMLQIYDRVLNSRSEETLVALFGLVTALYAFFGLLEFARGRVMARVGARIQATMDSPVFTAILERAALRKGSGRGTLMDLDAVRSIFASPVFLALMDMPWTPIFLLAIFIFHPLLGWLAVLGGAIMIIATLLNQALTRKKTGEAAYLSEGAQQFARQAEMGGELLWAQGMGKAMMTRWLQQRDAATEQSLRANDYTGSFSSFTKAFRFFLQSAMLALGAWLVLANEVSPGAMIAASILLGRALAPIDTSISQWPAVQRARAGWLALNKLFAEIPPRPEPTELPAPTAHLSVKNLSLVVKQGEAPILRNVSFEVLPGEALGVIGPSGSGKTTLARVLVGLIEPTAGEVRLAGATLDQYGSDRLGRHVGYLPQDVQLFPGSVAENLAQMAQNPDPKKLVAAAQKANVHDIILSLPDGYDTTLDAGTAYLSGGQKQRLTLARALYNNPVLLVLDEPNSALDSEGTNALNSTITAMKADGHAVLIMTHRPTAISACDKLLVIDHGMVKGFGPRDEIINKLVQNADNVQRAVQGPKAS